MSNSDDPLSNRHRRVASASVKIYRKLLLAYPEDFREEYASEMARYFGELCGDALREGGLAALAMVWIRTLYELAVSAKLQRTMNVPPKEIRPHDAVMAAMLLFPGAGQAYNNQWLKSGLHVLLIPMSMALLLFLFPKAPAAEWYALLTAAVIWAYSALEAWTTARRMKAIQRAEH